MKPAVIIISLLIGVLFGVWKGLKSPKPVWWRIVTLALILFASVLTLAPPLAGTFDELAYFGALNKGMVIPVGFTSAEAPNKIAENHYLFKAKDDHGTIQKVNLFAKIISEDLAAGSYYIADMKYDNDAKAFNLVSIKSANPLVHYPYIVTLEERVKILNFHVPVAWVSVLAYLVAMIYSIQYLRKREHIYDTIAVSSAALGTMFAILATVTGMVWAKFNWGSYWNWDPRETSIFVLLLIYAAYFALRGSIDKPNVRARISAVYAIIAFVSVPFLVFVLPRITSGLHPGSQGETSGGPVLTGQTGMLDSSLLIGFGLSMAAFTMFYFWMLNLQTRINIIKDKIEEGE